MKKTFNRFEPLINYLNYILIDENKNQAYVTQEWSGRLVEDGIKRGYQTYKYVDIKWGDPYIKPLTEEFNKEGNIMIIGKAINA